MTVFSGCCKPKIEYVDKEKKVYIPQKCVVPEPSGCKWDNVPTIQKPIKMMECIVELKKNSEVCK